MLEQILSDAKMQMQTFSRKLYTQHHYIAFMISFHDCEFVLYEYYISVAVV